MKLPINKPMEKEYIRIFKDKNGEWDFGVSGLVSEISNKEVREFRSIIITAIYIAEDMLRRKWEKENKCADNPIHSANDINIFNSSDL